MLETFYPTVNVENLSLPASYMRKELLVVHIKLLYCVRQLKHHPVFASILMALQKTRKNRVVINDTVLSMNKVSDGTALTAIDDIPKELEKLRTTAKLLGLPNANSINWTMLVSSTSDSAPTQKRLNKLIQEHREEDEKRFGAATTDTVELIETFCTMHLGANLRKAFVTSLDSDVAARKHNSVDQFVHEVL